MDVCLFDIDGTLLRSGGAGKAAMYAALADAFGVAEVRDEVPFSGRTDRAIARDLFALHGVADTPAHRARFLDAYLARLPGCLARHDGQVLPGIADLLRQLAARAGLTVGLLTGNTRAGARIKLGHYGLAGYFACGGFGDEHFDRCDVARAALADVCRHRGCDVDPARVWVVGDTPLDVECARAIGARVAAVATGWHSLADLECCRPDLVLADLRDASALLDRCGPAGH